MIDVVAVWPRWMDYPLFRQTMNEASGYYNRLIVSWTGTDECLPVMEHVRQSLPSAIFVSPIERTPDWRHNAVVSALEHSTAGHVLFLEQDFLVYNPLAFFNRLGFASESHPLIGFKEGARLHPACLCVAREVLERTSKDFSAGGVGHDHFWRVAGELEGVTPLVGLDELGLERGRDWRHMAGLTHNYDLARRNQPPVYKPLEFALYNLVCLSIGSCPEFAELMRRCVLPARRVLFDR